MQLSTGITSLDLMMVHFIVFIAYLIAGCFAGLRLPPGPAKKPIIGNLTDIPQGPIYEKFDEWASEYGDLVHIKLLDQHLIIVNSLDIARDLFEKRSTIYSDRVHLPMVTDLIGWDWNFAFLRYGQLWRRHRKMFHQHFNHGAVVSYQDVQTRQTRAFLKRLYDSPANFIHHIRHLAAGTIMEITYGIKILQEGDPYLKVSDAVLAAGSEAAAPGKFLVDTLPFLKHVPEWMPGAGFQRKGREWRIIFKKMADNPFNTVKNSLRIGTAEPSIAAKLLEGLSRRTDAPPDEEILIRNITAMAYAGGADTTVSTLSTFILLMVLYPAVQQKAQLEVDKVTGNRLPLFEDCHSLPYVTALCKEVHRWHPAFPIGFGHRLMRDDAYGDYFLPEGSVVIGNAWSILRDERVYGPNREVFDPERFLRPGSIDPVGHFGFGRRVCPGRYLADNSIFIAVASILKVFDISPAKDNEGNEIPVKPAYDSNLLSHPEPFGCTIKPRSEWAKALLQSR